jgi:hypothetical protein
MKKSLCVPFSVLLFASALSPLVLGQAQKQIPEKPIQLEVKTNYEGAMGIAELKWRDMSENELGFEVLRSDNGEEYREVGMVGANTERYRDKVGKYVAGVYTYKVRAFNEAGRSEATNEATAWF